MAKFSKWRCPRQSRCPPSQRGKSGRHLTNGTWFGSTVMTDRKIWESESWRRSKAASIFKIAVGKMAKFAIDQRVRVPTNNPTAESRLRGKEGARLLQYR